MGCFTTKAKLDHNQRNPSNFSIVTAQQQEQVVKNQSTNSPQCLPLCKINGQPDLFNSPLQKSPSIETSKVIYFVPDEEAKNLLKVQSIRESPKNRYSITINQVKTPRLSLNAQEKRDSYGEILRNLKKDSKKSRNQRYSIQTLQEIF